MNQEFRKIIDTLEADYQKLRAAKPTSMKDLPKGIPESGVYVFSKDNEFLYVGRSDRLPKRLLDHRSNDHRRAAFAFLLAREHTKRKASYTPKNSREALIKNPAFKRVFDKKVESVKGLNVQYIEVKDPLRQALLEMYVAIALKTKYNAFANH